MAQIRAQSLEIERLVAQLEATKKKPRVTTSADHASPNTDLLSPDDPNSLNSTSSKSDVEECIGKARALIERFGGLIGARGVGIMQMLMRNVRYTTPERLPMEDAPDDLCSSIKSDVFSLGTSIRKRPRREIDWGYSDAGANGSSKRFKGTSSAAPWNQRRVYAHHIMRGESLTMCSLAASVALFHTPIVKAMGSIPPQSIAISTNNTINTLPWPAP